MHRQLLRINFPLVRPVSSPVISNGVRFWPEGVSWENNSREASPRNHRFAFVLIYRLFPSASMDPGDPGEFSISARGCLERLDGGESTLAARTNQTNDSGIIYGRGAKKGTWRSHILPKAYVNSYFPQLLATVFVPSLSRTFCSRRSRTYFCNISLKTVCDFQ